MLINFKSTHQISLDLSANLKRKRKWMKHSREKASQLSGVPAATIRRFEDTGDISCRQLLMLSDTYGDMSFFNEIFTLPKARTMNELIKIQEQL